MFIVMQSIYIRTFGIGMTWNPGTSLGIYFFGSSVRSTFQPLFQWITWAFPWCPGCELGRVSTPFDAWTVFRFPGNYTPWEDLALFVILWRLIGLIASYKKKQRKLWHNVYGKHLPELEGMELGITFRYLERYEMKNRQRLFSQVYRARQKGTTKMILILTPDLVFFGFAGLHRFIFGSE